MSKDYLKIFQEGGPVTTPPPAGAGPGAGTGGPNPDEMLAAVVETQDPNMALEFCNMLASQMGIAPGGGGAQAPAPAGPDAGGAPPMGRYGMKVPVVKL